MSRLSLSLAVLLTLFAMPARAQKEFGFDNRKSSGQPYLKPEESVAPHEGGRRLRGQALRRRAAWSSTRSP